MLSASGFLMILSVFMAFHYNEIMLAIALGVIGIALVAVAPGDMLDANFRGAQGSRPARMAQLAAVRSDTPKILWFVPMGALGVALLDMPYGYYQLLRILIFCVAAYLAYRSSQHSETGWPWILGGIAIVYNPFASLHLGRDIWPMINVGTIGILAGHMWHFIRGSNGVTTKESS